MIILTLPDRIEKRLESLSKKTKLSAEMLALCAIEEFLDIQDKDFPISLEEEKD